MQLAHAAQGETDGDLTTAMARRSIAFDRGEDAFWKNAIGADAYMLYRLLVRLCRQGSWCWPGLHWLAERTRVSVGTIKRRLDELEQAGLIRRHQRPGGLTARTVVLALVDEYSARPTPDPHDEARAATSSDTAAFFCAGDRVTDAPADGSAMIPQTMDSQTTNGGEGMDSRTDQVLRLGGVLSPRVRAELALRSSEDVERCLALARAQPNVRDPAALAVALLRADHARSAQRHPSNGTRPARQVPTARHTRGARSIEPSTPLPAATTGAPSGDHEGADVYDAVWERVRAVVAPAVGASAMTTWFADAGIAALDDHEAVVVVGNVLARTWIREHAVSALGEALRAVLGRPVAVAIELA